MPYTVFQEYAFIGFGKQATRAGTDTVWRSQTGHLLHIPLT